jgi:phosphoribosylformylglycinamidine cyclo-ligase
VPRGPSSEPGSLTYAATGIDLDRRRTLVEEFRRLATTSDPRVLAGVGPFASLFHLAGYRDPVIAASVDSVGTKLRLAIIMSRFEGIGADIVNHCVNDVLTSGAAPLFFLDYIGSSDLSDQAKLEIVAGVAKACGDSGCVLIGGETADMPDIYSAGDFDLVGVLVGACERDEVLGPHRVRDGDLLIGIPSNGLHTNGYSLVRRAFGVGLDGDAAAGRRALERHYDELGETLADALLRPHRSYLSEVQSLVKDLHAIAHITGGGIEGNLERVIPDGLSAAVRVGAWPSPPIFQLIESTGIDHEEMYRVFNMGLGIVLVIPPEKADDALRQVTDAVIVGEVRRGEQKTSLEDAR